jgi:hypothetical protein
LPKSKSICPPVFSLFIIQGPVVRKHVISNGWLSCRQICVKSDGPLRHVARRHVNSNHNLSPC